MSTAKAYMADNAVQIEVSEGYENLKKYPKLLFPNEKIHLAFQGRGGKGRDSTYFTSSRILLRDVKGMSGKQKRYKSIPYKSIKAFAIETAGSMDSDTELKIYSNSGIGKIKLDFVSDKVNIYAINKFLSLVVFEKTIPNEAGTVMPTTDTISSGFFGSFSDNSSQVDASFVREKYSEIFLENEDVELAFKCGRDMTILTSKRMIRVDVKGMSGSKIEFLSIKWDCIKAYKVETAGRFDRDCDIMLFTNLDGSRTRMEMDLYKGTCDVLIVQKYFADKLLGIDHENKSIEENMPASSTSHNMLSWLGDDNMAIDPVQINQRFHSDPPLLQNSERVEMAFKGRRDIILFTTKRLIVINYKGWSGKKVEYSTIPWNAIQAFGVRSAGSFDKDCEAFVWTNFYDIYFPPSDGEGPPPPPEPRMSFLEFDFKNTAVDLMAIQRYLAERCLKLDNDELLPVEEFTGSSSSIIKSFLAWLGGDHHEINPVELNNHLQANTPVLTKGENVIMGFQSGRDTTVFTNKRILTIDVKGMSGKKTEWRSIPYTSIRGFSAESAGSWDLDSELTLYCKTYWDHEAIWPHSKAKIDFKKGKADIIAIQSILTHYIIGSANGTSTINGDKYEYKQDTTTFETFSTWITNDAKAIDPGFINKQLHSSPNILCDDEIVDHVYKAGRDLIVFTTKRILIIDRKGHSGKKVKYVTYPLRYCAGYSVQSAGSVSKIKPPEVHIYTDIPGKAVISQDLEKGKEEMWNLQSMLGMKLLVKK